MSNVQTVNELKQPLSVWRLLKERSFIIICFTSTTFGLFALAALLYDIGILGAQAVNWDFITSPPSRRPEQAGIYPALIGTIWLMVLTAGITVPLGVGAAMYLEEFAPKNRLTRLIQLNITNLAGVPSIVYGLLGLAVFVRMFQLGQSVLAGALTLSLLVLPVVITASQEAIRAVPNSFREGALALGATRWEALRTAILPNAVSGILTGVILSLSRAIGEAAPLIVVGAATYIRFAPQTPMDAYTAMPIQIYNWAQMPQIGFRTNSAGAIVVLMVVLILFNSTALYLRYWSRKNRH